METFFTALWALLIGGILPIFTHRFFNAMKVGYIAITTLGCIVGLVAVVPTLMHPGITAISWPWLHIFSLSFSLDSLSAFFLLPIFFICPLTAIYTFHYMNKRHQSRRTAVNFFFFTLLNISMALVVTADNIISFALVWELMSLSSFFVVMYEYQREATRKAGYIYFVFAQAGAMLIFAALALVYSHTGSFAFAQFARIPSEAKLIVFILALIGFGSKAGIFPIHIWLPHAHPAAPSHISAVMSGVMLKMGIYGIVRFYSLLQVKDLIFGQTVLIFGIISGILGIVYALGKQDIKRILAYSSIENIGVILIGAGIGMIGSVLNNPIMAGFGFAGCLLHVLNHSIFKSLLFMSSGAVIQKTKRRRIDQMGGLMKKMPFTSKAFLVGSISISGLPPFNGFISEFLIYFAAFQGLNLKSSAFILIMLSIISLALIGGLASACFSRVIGIVFLGEPRSENAAGASECSLTMILPMMVLAFFCLVIGVFPQHFVNLAFWGLRDIHGYSTLPPDIIDGLCGNLASAARFLLGLLALTVFIRKVLYHKKIVGKGPTWGCGFTRPTMRMQYTGMSYAMSIVDFFRPFVLINTSYSDVKKIFPQSASYETKIDDIAESYLHKRFINPLLKMLSRMRWIQHGNIQLYIGYIVITIVVLMFFVW
jgi:hydrogenase-4 component B